MIENFLRPPRSAGEATADALRVLGLVSVIIAAFGWEATDAGVLAFALPALLLPRFLGSRAWFDIVFCLTVLVAAWSNVVDLYTTVPGWDLVVHFVATGVLSIGTYQLLARLRIVPTADTALRRVPIVLVTAIGLALSALWEMVEWFGWAVITDTIFVAYEDTIADMTVGGLGALAAGILLTAVPVDRDAERPADPQRQA